jgi:fucose permease
LRQYHWSYGYRTVGLIQACLAALLFFTLFLWQGAETRNGAAQGARQPIKAGHGLAIQGVKPALLSFLCYCAIESSVGLWGASFLVMARGITPDTAARWTALFFTGIMAGRFLSGFLTIKLNSRQMVRLGQAVLLLGVLLLLLPLGNGALISGFFLIGLGCAPIYPSLIHETPENFGAENSQTVIGLQMASAYVGTTLMPPLFGWVASSVGFNLFAPFLGIILLAQVALVERLNRVVAH